MDCRIAVFCEDAGHEEFARAAIERVAVDVETAVSIEIGSSRAGLGRMCRELRVYTEMARRRPGLPSVLVVLADANDVGETERRRQIEEVELGEAFPYWVIGIPDPCVEAWLLADPPSFTKAFGRSPGKPPFGDADDLKAHLRRTLEDADEIVTRGGVEFADEIVTAMDIYRAGKQHPTLKRFFDDLQKSLRAANAAVI